MTLSRGEALTVKERKRRYLSKWYWWLMEQLGTRCAVCGSEEQLEFDHPNGRAYDVTRLQPADRIRQYKRDWLAGNLRLLCKPCNGHDGGRRRWGRRARWERR